MKPYIRITLAVLMLASWLLAGCAKATPQVIQYRAPEPTSVVVVVEKVVEKTVEVELIAAPAYVAPDADPGPSTGGTDEPNDQPFGDVFFKNYGVNPRIDTDDDHFSTFAVDVDTASYTVMRRFITDGYLPNSDSVRVEEYINFFDQDYDPPAEGAFAIHLEGAPSPYADKYHLVRVGLKGYEIDPESRKDVVLTFVIDVSGSMAQENRLELVKDALGLLVDELRPTDEVGIVVYGSTASVILEPTPVSDKRAITRAIRKLRSEGSTNAEEGLVMAYQMASDTFNAEAINRVILCSDGVANVGRTGPDSILEQIEEYAEEDIYLTTVGFGMGNYNDVLMEQLADAGDGFYAYVDDLKEAERVFVHDLTATLQVIARDAKIQVEFNPAVVRSYRLIGYENRAVADEDFRDDTVDAGEIGVGHSVTALYEVKLQPDAPAQQPALTVYVRYEDPDTGEVLELSRMIAPSEFAGEFAEATPHFQLAVVVAQYAEVLRESYWATEMGTTLEDLHREARRIAEYLPRDEDVQEFAQLTAKAVELYPTVQK